MKNKKSLLFNSREFEAIKDAASNLKKENGDKDHLYDDEFLKTCKDDDTMYFHDLGWLSYSLKESGQETVLYFEYNTVKYFGTLEFIKNKDDSYSIFDNEVITEFNTDIKDKIEWLMNKFGNLDWSLDVKETNQPKLTVIDLTKEETKTSEETAVKPTIQPMIAELESLFSKLNDKFFDGELETPVITIAPDTCRAYGWFTTWRAWKETQDKEGKGYYEITITSDYLDRDPVDTGATLLHEMVHLYNKQKGIQDCSRSGHYHNAKFRDAAIVHGLETEKTSKSGYGKTSPTPETAEYLKSLDLNFDLYRPTPTKDQKVIKKSSTRKYVCPTCGNIIRATKSVRVICADCDVEYEEV